VRYNVGSPRGRRPDRSAFASEVLQFVRDHDAKSVVMIDRIIGCLHEEEIDYPKDRCAPSAHSGRTAIAGP
jgi:hypothetical protein